MHKNAECHEEHDGDAKYPGEERGNQVKTK